MYKSVLDYFEKTVQRVPQKMAVRHKEEECTFARLQEKAQKLGSYIIKLAGSVKIVRLLFYFQNQLKQLFLIWAYHTAAIFLIIWILKHQFTDWRIL